MVRQRLYSFFSHNLKKVWIQTSFFKKSSLRLSGSVISVSLIGSIYRHHALADATFDENHEEVTKPHALKVDAVISNRGSNSLLNKLLKLLRWLQRKIETFVTLVSRSIYLLLAFSPATLSAPLLLIAGDEFKRWWWSLLRDCIRNSGPCSTKLAQWIATRPDLFPLSLCKNLEDLQSRAYRHPWSSTEQALILAFGKNWTDSLVIDQDTSVTGTTFAPVVLGSGCVASVVLGKVGERQVAVKIIHPGVREAIDADVTILHFLGWLVEKIPGMENFSLAEMVEEFSILMMQQLDMNLEAKNLEKFRLNFNIHDGNLPLSDSIFDKLKSLVSTKVIKKFRVTFPEPIRPFVTQNVLVESYEKGTQISDILSDITNQKMRKDIAIQGLDAVLKMVFEDNFIHADLHPGNVIYHEYTSDKVTTTRIDKSSPLQSASSDHDWELSFIDAGLVATLEKGDRRNFIEVFAAVVQNDGKRVGQLMIERSRGGGLNCVNPEGFADEIGELVKMVHVSGLSLGRVGIGALLQRVLVLCYIHQVKLEPKFVSVMVAMAVVEGLGKRLDPDVDVLMRAAPYVLKAALFS